MRLNTKVHESIVAPVRPRQSARIKVDAFPKEILTGTVEEVHPLPDSNRRFNQGIKVYTTNVKSTRAFAASARACRPKSRSSSKPSPTSSACRSCRVLHFEDKDHVMVQKPDGGFEWREVMLGRGQRRARRGEAGAPRAARS